MCITGERFIVEGQGTRLLVKVAQLYHLQGLNQDQIGRQLGVSRSKVSRMLKKAAPPVAVRRLPCSE
jgi:DNA-binding transcriptional regulator LsrR (DeoR family)